MLVYAGYKISILEGKKSIDIIQTVKENQFSDEDVFGANQGLNIAVGVFNPWDSHTLEPIDPSYGTIDFINHIWRVNEENGKFEADYYYLETHTCSQEELGLSGGNDKQGFWPINK